MPMLDTMFQHLAQAHKLLVQQELTKHQLLNHLVMMPMQDTMYQQQAKPAKRYVRPENGKMRLDKRLVKMQNQVIIL